MIWYHDSCVHHHPCQHMRRPNCKTKKLNIFLSLCDICRFLFQFVGKILAGLATKILDFLLRQRWSCFWLLCAISSDTWMPVSLNFAAAFQRDLPPGLSGSQGVAVTSIITFLWTKRFRSTAGSAGLSVSGYIWTAPNPVCSEQQANATFLASLIRPNSCMFESAMVGEKAPSEKSCWSNAGKTKQFMLPRLPAWWTKTARDTHF